MYFYELSSEPSGLMEWIRGTQNFVEGFLLWQLNKLQCYAGELFARANCMNL